MSQISKKLYEKLQRQYSRRINLDLNRIKKALLKLNNPQYHLENVINVIGSDGKNSFLTSLKFFLEADNQKVNTFTSPHLFDVRHRFWLGTRFISIKEILNYKKIIEKTKIKLTLFELLTCVFILSAKNSKAGTYNLIESGLLFKKDSTNLWEKPMAQVVTNINFQHQEWVRPKTLNEICKQKVGYLSKNSNIYVGKQKLNTSKIIKKILKNNPSEKLFYGSWKIIKIKDKKYYQDKENLIRLESKKINSEGLWENVGLAIKVALDLGIKSEKIKKTIPKIEFEGRVQFIKGKLSNNQKNKILIDGCHSDASTKNLAKYLKKFKTPIYGIWGSLKNKNPDQLIKNFKGIFKEIITIKIPNESNAMSAFDLRKIAEKNGFKAIESDGIKNSIKKLSRKEKKIIVIFGSLYLAGHALSLN